MDEPRTGEGGAANTPPFPPPPLSAAPTPLEGEPAADTPEIPSADAPAAGPSSTGTWRDRPTGLDGQDEPDDGPDDVEDGAPALRPRLARTSEEVRRRAASGLNQGFDRIADRLEEAAERLGRLAEDQLDGNGPRGRAGDVAQSTAAWLDDTADYLRTADLRRLQTDLERQVRDKPIQTLLLAVGAGWLLGKIMR